uniref:Deoxyribose-phosphate aldolase n=1 Tax=Anaerolinea thermolimosa TaxID=229919 RepID=A0A7C4PL30_9CHLR
MDFTYEQIAKMIDHSLLNPTIPVENLERGIQVALDYQVASVCIMPYYARRCAELLAGSQVIPGTVIGFPHGVHSTSIKIKEAEQALEDGCIELDMVVNISQVLSGGWEYVRQDIKGVVDAAHARQAKVKVIFENCYLNEAQKIRLCEICGEIGADWVKTSTGFGTGGATNEDLILMRAHSPAHVQVKAAGGIRSLERLLEVRALGVTRCGATATVAILEEARRQLGLPSIAAGQEQRVTGY